MGKTGMTRALLCDLDGVVWLAHEPIPGSVEAIARCRDAGLEVLFVTNNSFSTRDQQHAALASIGIDATGRVMTSAMAAARLVAAGERVLVVGGEGLVQEAGAAGAEVVVAHEHDGNGEGFDAVLVGFHRQFSFEVLTRALTAVRSGARLIGSNRDRTYPTPGGPIPGGGSMLAAIEHATGVEAVVTGKPHAPMAELVAASLPGVDPSQMVMVGDLVETDGAFARTIGARFALVLSGMTATADGIDADVVGRDLAGVVTMLLEGPA